MVGHASPYWKSIDKCNNSNCTLYPEKQQMHLSPAECTVIRYTFYVIITILIIVHSSSLSSPSSFSFLCTVIDYLSTLSRVYYERCFCTDINLLTSIITICTIKLPCTLSSPCIFHFTRHCFKHFSLVFYHVHYKHTSNITIKSIIMISTLLPFYTIIQRNHHHNHYDHPVYTTAISTIINLHTITQIFTITNHLSSSYPFCSQSLTLLLHYHYYIHHNDDHHIPIH